MRFFLMIYSVCILSNLAYSQNWEKQFGVSNHHDLFEGLAESYDKGYIILGAKDYYPDTRGVIYKTDINGNLLYQFTLGTGTNLSQGNYPAYVEPTSDGGFIVCGSHERWTPNDIGISKHDACGNLEWCKIYRTDNHYDWGRVVKQLSDGGYIMLTHQYNGLAPEQNTHLFRFNQSGDLLWIQPYAINPNIETTSTTDLVVASNSDFFMTGHGYWCENGDCRLKALSIYADSNKNEQWVFMYNRYDNDYYSASYKAVQKGSGNFYVGATDVDRGYLPMLLTLDSAGNIVSDTTIQLPVIDGKWADCLLIDPKFTNDNRLFLYTVYTETDQWDTTWIGIHEVDSLGGWHNTFLHPAMHNEARMILTHDQKLLVAAPIGYNSDQNIMLIKLNTSLEYDSIYTAPLTYDYLCPDTITSKVIDLAACEVIVDVKDVPTPGEFYNSIKKIPVLPVPNPASDEISFRLKNTEYHKKIQLVCYDIYGREIFNEQVNSGIDEVKVDISSLGSGIYSVVIFSENIKVGSNKFIVQ